MVTLRESSLHSRTRACLDVTTLTFSTRAKCRNGVVCVSVVCVLQSVSACAWCLRVCACVFACACVPSVPVFGSLLQAPSLVSHWNIALGISVLSLFPKFSPPEAFTRVNRYRRRGIEHKKHSTITQTLSKQGCDYNNTLPCRHHAFHKRADTAKFKADKMSKHELQLLTCWRDPYVAKTSNCAAQRVPLKFRHVRS